MGILKRSNNEQGRRIAGNTVKALSPKNPLKAYVCVLIFLAAASPLFATDVLVVEPNGRILINVNGASIDLVEYLVPVGSIQPFAGGIDKVPAGWELCDGRSVSSADQRYARLYSVIWTAFGNGSKTGTGQAGSGNFNLPDLRGRFIRGFDMGAGRDPDRGSRIPMTDGGLPGDAVGSIQKDALQTHRHAHIHSNGAEHRPGYYDDGYYCDPGNSSFNYSHISEDPTNSAAGNEIRLSENETRPVNIYLNFIIKL